MHPLMQAAVDKALNLPEGVIPVCVGWPTIGGNGVLRCWYYDPASERWYSSNLEGNDVLLHHYEGVPPAPLVRCEDPNTIHTLKET